MADLRELEEHLRRSLPSLQGNWISGKTKYERSFASAIGATFKAGRYWDCIWQGIYLELKMGKSGFWLDLVRYSECLLERTPERHVAVVTLFTRYQPNRITDMYAVATEKLIKGLNLSTQTAENLLRIKGEVPRGLNAQARLTMKDISKIAEFHIH